jgi:hypothetical protein
MNLSSLTLVPQLDRSPRWVAFAQTIPGKLCLVAAFAGMLFLHDVVLWWLISLYLTAFSLWPQHRWQILLAATWSYLLVGPTDFNWERINGLFRGAGITWQINSTSEGLPLVLVAILFAALWLWLTVRFSRQLRRPVLTLVCVFLGLMMCASYAPLPPAVRAFLWAFLAVFGQYFWFVCYSLKECRAQAPLPRPLHFATYLPFWEPSSIPYPKGAGYLKKIAAKTAEELAVCQLKGLKLLLWALWLRVFYKIFNVTLYGYDEILFGRLQFKRELGTIRLFFDGNYLYDLVTLPFSWLLLPYEAAFTLVVNGNPLPWHTNWAVLVLDFLGFLIYVAFSTHIIIAIIRMCGFYALRNTYRPLASKNIAEFWNRYLYYFKELLV